MDAITLSHLSKRYKDVEAIRDISFSVKKGDFFGFIGPNGAGKTTTISSIMGLVNFEGSIKVMGKDVVRDYETARMKVGLSPQEYNFDRFLTVHECLFYTAGYYGLRKPEILKRTETMLKRFNLWEKRSKRTEQLSGGMKRRLIIARALIHNPDILILDEPTAGIDVQLRREFWDILTDINKEGKTIILTSHYIEEVERLCSTIAIINKGKILELDKKSKIMNELADQTLAVTTDRPFPQEIIRGADLYIRQDGNRTQITGKGVKKLAPTMIKTIESRGFAIQEIDVKTESLENVFVRITGDDNGK